jgi:inosine-uridine nucleoside N-ribohydrolase
VEVHLDTDFGGDPDDACALAMLLGWPGVDVVAVTTNLDDGGTRAGCAQLLLQLAGRAEVLVIAGAESSMTTGERFPATAGDRRYWPRSVVPAPADPAAAPAALRASIDRGATVVAIGALTNLARLELAHPGALRDAQVVAMAGWIDPPDADMPQWGAEMDFNAQCDTHAVEIVASAAHLTLVTLPAAMHAQQRARDLPRLRAAGDVGALLADQSEVYARDRDMGALATVHPGLSPDLVNFHWDPVTAAVAVGWDGARVEERVLACAVDERGVVRFVDDPAGRPALVVTAVDGEAFAREFLARVEAVRG